MTPLDLELERIIVNLGDVDLRVLAGGPAAGSLSRMACRARIRGDSGWRSSAIVRFRSATRASCSSSARPGDAPQRRAQPLCAAVGSRPEFRAERMDGFEPSVPRAILHG